MTNEELADTMVTIGAGIVAEGERVREEMANVRDELGATRTYLRATQEDRARVLGAVTEANQLARKVVEDTAVIRGVVESLSKVVGELQKKLKDVKLPKWLGNFQ